MLVAAVYSAPSRQALPCAPQAKLARRLVFTALPGLGRAVYSWVHPERFNPLVQLRQTADPNPDP